MGQLRGDETRGRWALPATVLGSGLAMLDATVVTIALGADLDAGSAGCSGPFTATQSASPR